MLEDIERLNRHLQQPEFHFRELRLSEAAEAACQRWPLLQSIRATAPVEPSQSEPNH